MIRHFINWKKNIQPISWKGIAVTLDLNQYDFQTYWIALKEALLVDSEFVLYDEINSYVFNDSNSKTIEILKADHDHTKPEPTGRRTYVMLRQRPKYRFLDEGITFGINAKEISSDIISKVASIKGVRLAYLYNPYFRSWENMKFFETYKFRGGLKKIYDPVVEMNVVDLSKRPGRYTVFDIYGFSGGSQYWIHRSLIDESSLLELPLETTYDETTQVYHIKLFDLNKYWSDHAQERINMVRKLLNVDK